MSGRTGSHKDQTDRLNCNALGQKMAARVRALAAYKKMISLTLWKDADPDIPILKEAKAEYAKLQ